MPFTVKRTADGRPLTTWRAFWLKLRVAPFRNRREARVRPPGTRTVMKACRVTTKLSVAGRPDGALDGDSVAVSEGAGESETLGLVLGALVFGAGWVLVALGEDAGVATVVLVLPSRRVTA